METQILNNLHQPLELEKLYRSNKAAFKTSFSALYAKLEHSPVLDCWNARLSYSKDEISWGSKKDLYFVLIICFIAGCIAKLPELFSIDENFFYPRNIGFIVFPMLTAFFAWKNKLSAAKLLVIGGLIITAAVFINLLPNNENSDTLILSCIHLILFLWALLGIAFMGKHPQSNESRLQFLSFNGDLVVLTTLITIAGGLLTAVTVGLFSLIGLNIENFYFQYIAAFLLPAAPIVATYINDANPQLVSKVSPVIARIFSPLVLVMLVTYLVAVVYSGRDPYNDRQFLLIFNGLLIGVMAIIFFSIAEATRSTTPAANIWILLFLAVVTILVNGIALSAIVFRISEWGITPNRAAVLGGNLLILFHLFLVTMQLFKWISNKATIHAVGNAMAAYLPVYIVWSIIVTFLFPFIFGFR